MQQDTNISSESKKKSPVAIIAAITLLAIIGSVGAAFLGAKLLGGETKSKPSAPSQPKPVISRNQSLIISEDIYSVTLKYYEGYNIATGDAISDVIPLNVVELKGDDYDDVVADLKALKKLKIDKNSEEYRHLVYDNLMDYYELDINGDIVIYIGEKYGYTKTGSNYFEVPVSLYQRVRKIAATNSEENLYQEIGGDQFTVTHDEADYEIEDTDQIKTLSGFKYYIINDTEDSLANEKVAYIINTHDGRTISVYYASVLGRIDYEDGNVEFIYCDGLEELLGEIVK